MLLSIPFRIEAKRAARRALELSNARLGKAP
jgi:hypothetical protein